MNKSIIWNTQLYTVAEFARQTDKYCKTARQFIKIEEIDEKAMKLTVALNVSEIDSPTIQKMMIMIRQYKKLSLGYHEYGELINITSPKGCNI